MYEMTDIGRQFGTQSRRYAQHAEHDGLLGSGAFPRPSGCGGPSTAKSRATSQFPLNKTSEPYQPPRPYKVRQLENIKTHVSVATKALLVFIIIIIFILRVVL